MTAKSKPTDLESRITALEAFVVAMREDIVDLDKAVASVAAKSALDEHLTALRKRVAALDVALTVMARKSKLTFHPLPLKPKKAKVRSSI